MFQSSVSEAVEVGEGLTAQLSLPDSTEETVHALCSCAQHTTGSSKGRNGTEDLRGSALRMAPFS